LHKFGRHPTCRNDQSMQSLIPMTRKVHDDSGGVVETSALTWFVFPDQVTEGMEAILRPYGYEQDSEELPDADHFLGQIELMCRDEPNPILWAIIFYPTEYPLAGHLLSIRRNREIRFSNYSLCHPHKTKPYNPAISGPPPVSFVLVFSKSALADAAGTKSPLLKDAWSLLAEKSESDSWIVIADPLDPVWVQERAKESDELFFDITGISRSA